MTVFQCTDNGSASRCSLNPHPSEHEPTRSSRTKYSIIIQPEMLCDDYVCQISKLGTSNLPGSLRRSPCFLTGCSFQHAEPRLLHRVTSLTAFRLPRQKDVFILLWLCTASNSAHSSLLSLTTPLNNNKLCVW